jgi:Stage II sporulation protein E (SpoIIE)
LAAQIEPSRAVGGDALDYAQSATNDSLAFFEAVGYALGASLIAGCAIAAYRAARARVPFGVEHSDVVVGEEPLQPGDWMVLHTDGVTEARDHDGAFSAKSGCATSSLGKRRRGIRRRRLAAG